MTKAKLAEANEQPESERAGGPRAPLQARGKARIEAVLDATAALILEKGLAGVTMHGVARRAHTPIGSMYHFFPDRDSLLMALHDRHRAAMAEIEEEIDQVSMETWRGLSAKAVIDRIMSPYIDYLEQHPDALLLAAESPTPDNDKGGSTTLKSVIDARLPSVSAIDRLLYVDMLDALAKGALAIKLKSSLPDIQQAGRYLREVKRALAAYLTAVEKAVSSR